VRVENSLTVVVKHRNIPVGVVKLLGILSLMNFRHGWLQSRCLVCMVKRKYTSRRLGDLVMVDEDFVEDFEEEETLLAHVDANEGWEIDIDTLVDRIAGITTRSYEEWLARDRPPVAGEFVPVN